MNVRDYEYLLTLGKSGSISKASQELYISQPALSKFLKKTEEEIGTLLFQRVGKHLVPTYAGEQCIQTASQICFLHEQLQLNLSDIVNQNRGQIKIGLPMSRSSFFLSAILPPFYAQYPHVMVNIYEDSTSNLLKKLRSGDLTFIFINVHSELPDLIYQEISEEEMVLAAPASFSIGKNAIPQEGYRYPCVKPEDWIEYPFLMLSKDQMSRKFADTYFRAHDLNPNVVLKIRNLGQVLLSVQNGLGLTICPAMPLVPTAAQPPIEYYSLPSPGGPTIRRTSIVYRKDAYLSKAEKYLIDIIARSYR